MKKRKPPKPEDARDRKILADIKRVGWAVMGITHEGDMPTFSFSVGMYEALGTPEIMMMGLNPKMATNFINLIGEKIKKGERFEAGQTYDSLAEGFKTAFVNMERRHYKGYLGYAGWYYGDWDFPTMQCVWPDKKGVFPWEEGFEPRFFAFQRILGPIAQWPHGWPFGAPPNLTCFTLRQVVEENKPILRVTHDHDGSWQFLSGKDECTVENAMVVALEEMVKRDETLIDLADMPYGHLATRVRVGEKWIRRKTKES